MREGSRIRWRIKYRCRSAPNGAGTEHHARKQESERNSSYLVPYECSRNTQPKYHQKRQSTFLRSSSQSFVKCVHNSWKTLWICLYLVSYEVLQGETYITSKAVLDIFLIIIAGICWMYNSVKNLIREKRNLWKTLRMCFYLASYEFFRKTQPTNCQKRHSAFLRSSLRRYDKCIHNSWKTLWMCFYLVSYEFFYKSQYIYRQKRHSTFLRLSL